MKNTTNLSLCKRGLPIFHDASRLKYFALAGAVLLLFAAGCGSGSDAPPGVAANGDDPDRAPTERAILGTGWQLHEEPDPLTDTVVHSLSNEVANLQKDAPTLRFYLQCVEGSGFRDFQFGDVEVRFSSTIYGESTSFFDGAPRIGYVSFANQKVHRRGSGYRVGEVGVRWDKNEAEHQRFWRRIEGWRARGGLYTSAGPAHADPVGATTDTFLDRETAKDAARRFVGKMADHRTLLLRFYHNAYPHLDYRFDLRDFKDGMRVLRERCRSAADAD